jgi:hypothetical protein
MSTFLGQNINAGAFKYGECVIYASSLIAHHAEMYTALVLLAFLASALADTAVPVRKAHYFCYF